MNDLESTIETALSDATRASLAAAALAFERGEIHQREIAPGIWQLVQVAR